MMRSPTPLQSRRGMALVVVLALLVTLSVILVAFVSQSRVELAASSSFSHAVSSEALAKDAVNSVIESLRYEMEAGSKPVEIINGHVVYEPLTPLNMLPKLDSAEATKNVPSLLRTSAPGALFDGSSVNSKASPVTTDKPSLNGRKISLDRWNAPRLLTDQQNDSLPLPSWIYVDRQGPVQLNSWSATLGNPFTNGNVNPQYVIGRYAYRIYDASGLIDVNVAGFPGANAPPSDRVSRKGGLPWADLAGAGLPGWTPNPSQSQDLLNWRWPGAGYADYVDGDGAKSGFLRMPAGVSGINRFLNRSDLLSFLESSAASQFPDHGDKFARQVTVFSRELNAPAWVPDSNASAAAKAMNPSVASVRVTKAFTRRDGSAAKIGEPLVNRRFPLSKIALFQDPAGNAEEIRQYFGLEQNSDGTWIYVHGRMEDGKFNFSGDSALRERLKTLEEVAAGNPGSLSAEGTSDNTARDPNFFELLQAGILLESLGQGMNPPTHSPQFTLTDRNIARHILQIGTNLIDQWDADDDPTVIARTPFYHPTLPDLDNAINEPDPDISGVENLPYIYKVPWTFFQRFDRDVSTGTDNQPVRPWVSAFYQFQLWNPHRNAPNFGNPRKMRIVATGSPRVTVSGKDSNGTDIMNASYFLREDCVWPLGETWIAFDVNPGQRDFSSPHTLKSNDPAIEVAQTGPARAQYVYAPPGYSAAILGFHAGSMKLPYTRLRPSSSRDGTSHEERYDNRSPEDDAARAGIQQAAGTATSFQLQKQDARGHWLPVQTIPCIGTATHSYHVRYMAPRFGDDSQDLHSNRVFFRTAYMTADPRTGRFGYPQIGVKDDIKTDDLLANMEISLPNVFFGWLPSNPGGGAWINDALAQNDGGASFYADRGGTGPRLGDAAAANANPFSTLSERPIMLNRPFRSVAEMAYAHRGLPWKSLNFTGELRSPGGKNTADGALLDIFTIDEMPAVRGGVINLNAASQEAIKALLLKSEILAGSDGGYETKLSDAEADSAASAIVQYIHGSAGNREVADAAHVLQTPADMARMIQDLSTSQFSGWSKRKKDSLVAALAQVHSARTWNVIVDVVVQTGKFPPSPNGTLEMFSVTGERRLLVHLAIDRLTGELVDQLTETVTE